MEAFIGTIILFAGNYAPNGWAFCDGQLLNVNQQEALFAVIGSTYGGDGKTTFALPDLRGRLPMGMGQGPGLTSRPMGEQAGVESVALLLSQVPAHSHPLNASSQSADLNDPTGAVLAQTVDALLAAGPPLYTKNSPNATMAATSIAPAGGSQPHENMPPYLSLNYVICLDGIYPSHA